MRLFRRKLSAGDDPFSSLGPNTGHVAVAAGSTIDAYYNRKNIVLSIDTASAAHVYGLCASTGTPSSTNFHFVLNVNQPPFRTSYSGPIQLAASTGTIQVGVLEW